MATYTKFNQFVEDLVKGYHSFGTHTFKVMLTNTAPNASTGKIKSDITEISAGNGYTAGGNALTIAAPTQSAGTVKPIASADITITASGGTVGPFRYAVVYNDTQTSPVKPLVSFYDYGSSLTLNATESLLIDFDQINGLFSLV
jgi:hypothetical protein